ncbi:MAG: MBOAT family protein [Leptospirales bacterium]|nr:MBOAT family protein [Leptospirales bacterium]
MLFNSVVFLLFFLFVYAVYWALPGRARKIFLILASIFFYAAWGLQSEGWWGLRWTAQFLGITGLNYLATVRILKSEGAARKRWLGAIILLDLLNLGLFKYFDFLRRLLLDLGLPLPAEAQGFNLFLPLAISFYTFQVMAYVVDVYRGVVDRDYGFTRFFLFILFFPQLIAGPIMRSTDFMDQIDDPWIDRRRMFDGLWLALAGLTKKVLIADPMGQIVAPVFYEPQTYDGVSLLLAGVCFSIQVYCDFSGYTDIARGAARLLGYEIPENFLAPYFSRSAQELWQRWHITLATWLRDYIYIPLGGNRRGKLRTYVNLMITFTLGGLWHGADYTYVAWGAFWGALLAVERWLQTDLGLQLTPQKSRPLMILKGAFMFLLFCLGALMFRSQPVAHYGHSAAAIMAEMFGGLFTHYGSWRAAFAAGGADMAMLQSVFGDDLFVFRNIGPAERIALMAAGVTLFHMIQFQPGIFERWRRLDSFLLPLAAVIVLGWLMPAIAVDSHQFIYFVF